MTLKIIKLAASNVLRLRAVEIAPSGTVQIIAGKNGAGKSSVLNALWLALAGGAASREIPKPIRAGEDWAEVKVDIGDEKGITLIVTRTWDENGKATLTVKAADGATYKSPQTLLDGLIGSLSFDPLAFTRMSPKAQREALLELLGLDFSAADAERQRLYDIREDTGRRKRGYGDLPKLPKNAPLTEKSASDLYQRINIANRIEQQRRGLEHEQGEQRVRIENIERQIEEYEVRITALREEAVQRSTAIITLGSQISELPEPADNDALSAELAAVEDYNRAVRENRRITDARDAQKKLEEEYTALSHQIEAIDNSKATAIATADMPVPGLGFDSDGVTFNGVPFSQASSAEQIRVAISMSAAMNPTLRVIRIMDGSLLDEASMAAVRETAKKYDVQLFLEVVGDGGGDPTAIVIEDGEVQ